MEYLDMFYRFGVADLWSPNMPWVLIPIRFPSKYIHQQLLHDICSSGTTCTFFINWSFEVKKNIEVSAVRHFQLIYNRMETKTGNRYFILGRDTFLLCFGTYSLQKDAFELSEAKQCKLMIGSSKDCWMIRKANGADQSRTILWIVQTQHLDNFTHMYRSTVIKDLDFLKCLHYLK